MCPGTSHADLKPGSTQILPMHHPCPLSSWESRRLAPSLPLVSAGEEQWAEAPRTVWVAPALTKGRGSVCVHACVCVCTQGGVCAPPRAWGPGRGGGVCECVLRARGVGVCGCVSACVCVCVMDARLWHRAGMVRAQLPTFPEAPAQSREQQSQPLGLARGGQARLQALNPQDLL